jgi:hypothetical protein
MIIISFTCNVCTNDCSNYCNVQFKIGNIHKNIISIILVLTHAMSNTYYNNEMKTHLNMIFMLMVIVIVNK